MLDKLEGVEEARRRLTFRTSSWSKSGGQSSMSLEIHPSSGLLDTLHLSLPWKRGLPAADWHTCLDNLDTLERAVERQPWLAEWKKARFGRSISAQFFDPHEIQL